MDGTNPGNEPIEKSTAEAPDSMQGALLLAAQDVPRNACYKHYDYSLVEWIDPKQKRYSSLTLKGWDYISTFSLDLVFIQII